MKALLEAMNAWFQAHLVRRLGNASGLDALRIRIDAHLGSADRSAEATTALYAIYVESLCVMPELQGEVAHFNAQWRDGLAANLRQARERGEIDAAVDCEAEASFLLAAMRGLMIQYLMDRSKRDLARSKAILQTHVRFGLAVPNRREK
jgi:hypothetical protein